MMTMTEPESYSLTALQSRVSRSVEDEFRTRYTPADTDADAITEAEHETARKQASDLATSLAVKWLAENSPVPTAKHRREMRRYVRVNVDRLREVNRTEVMPDKCGFLFLFTIVGAILSWLIGKVLDHVWNTYKAAHDGPRLFAGLASQEGVQRLGVVPDVHPGTPFDQSDDGEGDAT